MSDDPNLLLKRNEWQRKLLGQCPAFESFFALAGYYLVIHYTGSGDSGDVDEICLVHEDDKAYDDFEPYWYKPVDEPGAICAALENGEVLDIIREFAWKMAYQANPGFEINDGGQGAIQLRPDGSYKIHHETNHTHVDYSDYEGAL